MASIDFQRVADVAAQRFVHIGNQCNHITACVNADLHHNLCQLNALFQRVHNGARACFNIQHNGLGAACQFFRHNASGDQWQAI